MRWPTLSPKPKATATDTPVTDWKARPDRAGRQRRATHHRGGAARAAAAGQRWEDGDRARERGLFRRR
ncbi:hypothetical protein [Streptomyces zhihengii]|uniref:Uncharacterized protein n=1 Tax=Streptomyces zhihengii TaxID=1818004 RepID=A0ABS2UTY5_9ACTN|nr:hypothetical protein [Streptomyces zhihengii]MBM9621011.1 hypothetical protein [Streptomyces zhihengii]